MAALVYAAFTDIKERKIKIWLFPSAALLSLPCFIYRLVTSECLFPLYDIGIYLAGAAAGFGVFFIFAFFGKGGGADAIMAGCMGLIFGITQLAEIFIIACVAVILWSVGSFVRHRIKKEKADIRKIYPLAPFVLFGFVADIIYNIIIAL